MPRHPQSRYLLSRHLPLLVVLYVITPFITLHFTLSPHLLPPAQPVTPAIGEAPLGDADKPDFSRIGSVPERKSQFFDYMEQHVAERNQAIVRLRQRLQDGDVGDEELLTLADRYRVRTRDPQTIRTMLLRRIDEIPASLVLAQAALESAWGTSRFAAVGNNFFGQWCFVAGCGLVPNRRIDGMNHEVMVFETPEDSVAAYMRNLNSHPAYRHLRERRAELRARDKPLNGCYLAQGLTHYSAKGSNYVEDLKLLIRTNRLEQDNEGHCAPTAVADESPEQASPQDSSSGAAPQTLAIDQVQGSLPQAVPAPPPSS